MAKQKTSTASAKKLVEDTVAGSVEPEVTETQEVTPVAEEAPVAIAAEEKVEAKTEEPKELRLVSTKNVPLYKIATKQRNMIVGTIVAGHTYPYKGKTQNTEGVFYNMGRGFVFAEPCVKIQ